MTACMFADNLVLADTMATLCDSEHLRPITPSNVSARDAAQESSVRLVRKLYILGTRTAVAFAGNGDSIIECLDKVASAMPALLHQDRPMRAVSEIVNAYPDVQMIGFTLLDDGFTAHSVSPNWSRFTTSSLGRCAAIGSGGAALRLEAEKFDVNYENLRGFNQRSRGRAFADRVNGECFVFEMYQKANDWGACFEHVLTNEENTGWLYSPPTAHSFTEFQET